MYDVIIIGARCAGSPTAMLLARKGYKVLLLDKAEFPSDTISTHIIFPKGVERLKRWGLLDKVIATNCPVIKRMGLNMGVFELRGTPPAPPGVEGIIAPRRTKLDKILADAAVAAGAELCEKSMVEEIIFQDGAVTGVRFRDKNGVHITQKAKVVIGADGRNSILAKAVKAEEYNSVPALTCWYYTYWSGVPAPDLVLHSRPNRAFGAIATNDGLACIPVAATAGELQQLRSDIKGNYLKTLEMDEAFAAVIKQGKIEDKFYGMTDLHNFFRKPFGPGWVLAGDAGYHKDPITGQGISDAFYAAESISEALDAFFSGNESFETAMKRYQTNRDEKSFPMYGLTCEWASLQPPPQEMQQFLFSLQGNQPEIDNFFGTLAGTVSIPEFFSPQNMERIMANVKV